jgi:diaminopimelate epimerase
MAMNTNRVTLSKHHGLGNDFLVCLVAADPAGVSIGPEHARAWCDRRRGVGADGLAVNQGTLDQPRMVLFNADGSRAEMSGNGIRCFAHAIAVARHGHDFSPTVLHIETDAGCRAVSVERTEDPATITASVSMGKVSVVDAPAAWHLIECGPLRSVAHLSVGNPHSVVGVDDVSGVDLVELGGLVPDVNLEIVAPGPERDAITMRVHERGVGVTQACGTGATAAAYAAALWGLVDGPEVVVHMDGGDVIVRLGDEPTLVGPATFVAMVHISTLTPTSTSRRES